MLGKYNFLETLLLYVPFDALFPFLFLLWFASFVRKIIGALTIELNKRKRLFSRDRPTFSFYFNNAVLEQTPVQKDMFVNLDSKLWFAEHNDDKINKAIKRIGLLRKLKVILQSYCFITKYKSFVKLHLEYGDVTCDQLFNNYF